ncbi:autoinducer binding domain-containing protein [Sphingobium sp. V4]|uniref:helix-turn-helix transcriptional regulator n=1 Tax=Sphingobium sp. V4 TaxID=3038927 RepID=UPI002557FB06|nr:autoinducer binding domain-containing protein [Sphingobium sp. V4]WIW89545.1 autoinducer binding domain-containing protein [Sphingobium sp. V4]
MIAYQNLEILLQGFRAADTESKLHEALARATAMLGFKQFALGHHVDLSCPPQGAIRLDTYDRSWVSYGLERGYFAEDPIHLASMKTVRGFAWHELGEIIQLTSRHKQILAEAGAFGLGAGFTVPVHLPGEYHGTCSFAARSMDDLRTNALPIAQLCGTFAFEAARRIMRRTLKLGEMDMPNLRPRELEALILVGRGKTDSEIGQILRISRATAHEHVEGARRAYGNAQRAFMIVRALFDGQITFADLLRR